MKDSALSTDPRDDAPASELEILLEAARRANWDPLKAPRHPRTGRYRPKADDGAKDGAACEKDDSAARTAS